MIWKNPFLIKHTEKIDSETEFLRLFSANTLRFLTEDKFSKVQFVRSSPGAGKTTLLKALTSNVLLQLCNLKESDSLRDFYQIASDCHLIENNQVRLLSCTLSCTKNYDLIDQIFQNGRRQQVLFALLSVRLTISLLKGIVTIKQFSDVNELIRITFKKYPDEFGMLGKSISNGFQLLQWAYTEEKKICEYIDNLSDEKTNFSFYYNTFFLLSIFEPHNILCDDDPFLNYSLIMFDDVQKLTEYQRELIINSFYVLRPQIGVWIGEKFDALSAKEIITSDASAGREFDKIELEDYWRSKGCEPLYKKTLENIADRRVQLSPTDNMGSFSSNLANDLNYEKYSRILSAANMTIRESIKENIYNGDWFSDVIEYIDGTNDGIMQISLRWQLLDILYKRHTVGQLRLDIGDRFSLNTYEEFCQNSNHRKAADYYMCIKNGIPFYYGNEKLKEISSYNIGQYLSFCAAIYEKVNAKKIITTGKKPAGPISVEDQEKYIKQTAEVLWNDISQRYLFGASIQRFLENLCLIAQSTRDRGTNPYTGGAITGIAIATTEIEGLKTNEKNAMLLKIISACISSNYFEKSLVEHGGKQWLRLYFNRWLCVKFNLPLKYGGWRKMSLEKLNVLTNKRLDLTDASHITIFDYSNQEVVSDE